MNKKPYISIQAAEEQSRLVAYELIGALREFNKRNPDPDAELVAESLSYVNDDYFVQLCALTLAETHIVVPDIGEKSNVGGLRLWVRDKLRKAERDTENAHQ